MSANPHTADSDRRSYVSWPFTGLLPHAYRVILVDAPTKFSSGPNRNPNNHYQTMTIAEIAALPIGELAHPDGCRLFMWVTMPTLHRGPSCFRHGDSVIAQRAVG
jgi:hypothetical protein